MPFQKVDSGQITAFTTTKPPMTESSEFSETRTSSVFLILYKGRDNHTTLINDFFVRIRTYTNTLLVI